MEIISDPKQCKRFDGCNSNLCPIDPLLNKRYKFYDEPLCFYVREFVKIEAGTTTEAGLNPLEQLIIEAVRKNIDLMKKIGGCKYRHKIERAAFTKSKKGAAIHCLGNTILRGPVAGDEGSPSNEREAA